MTNLNVNFQNENKVNDIYEKLNVIRKEIKQLSNDEYYALHNLLDDNETGQMNVTILDMVYLAHNGQ